MLEHLDHTIAGYGRVMSPWKEWTLENILTYVENFTMYAVMSNLTRFISNRFETDSISEGERLSRLERIFEVAQYSTASDLHDPPSHLEVIGNSLDMVLLLVETRPLVGHIQLEVVLSGLEMYNETTTILSILRCLCKNGLVDPDEFRLALGRIRRLTTLWDAKGLEEMTGIAWTQIIMPRLSLTQIKRTLRLPTGPPGTAQFTKKKGKLHRWLKKLRSG